MDVWTIANQKGGVGKTTTTVTLAGLLVQKGYRVLVVDTDPHGSLSTYLGLDCEKLDAGTYDLFTCDHTQLQNVLATAISSTNIEKLSILPASMALTTLDRQMGAKQGKGLVLKNAFECLKKQFDYVLIDCPPILGILMINALVACNQVIVPVQTEYLALKGLERMIRTLHIMSAQQGLNIPIMIIATMFDKRVNACIKAYLTLTENYSDELWKGFIPVDTRFRDASDKQMPIGHFAPKSRGSFAYQKLLKELTDVQS